MSGKKLIQEVKEKTKKDKVIVFQAFGRGTINDNGMIADPAEVLKQKMLSILLIN